MYSIFTKYKLKHSFKTRPADPGLELSQINEKIEKVMTR